MSRAALVRKVSKLQAITVERGATRAEAAAAASLARRLARRLGNPRDPTIEGAVTPGGGHSPGVRVVIVSRMGH
jgi:hypothetical protein